MKQYKKTSIDKSKFMILFLETSDDSIFSTIVTDRQVLVTPIVISIISQCQTIDFGYPDAKYIMYMYFYM